MKRAPLASTRCSRRSASIRPKGQLYEPVDKKGLSFYHEAKDGQILEEGITEAGSMASFVAAGTAYANYGVNLIPFYIYYSMFGPQRVGDEIWLAADSRAKGFLLGATSGRTTLNGEGLQHQDGHSPLMASTVPTLYVYDPAFGYEIAVIVCDGMRRMFEDGEEILLLPLPLQRKLRHAADASRGGRGHHQGLVQIQDRAGRQEAQGADSRQRQHYPLGVARAGNPGRTLRCFGGCLERHQLQEPAQRSAAGRALEPASSDRAAAKPYVKQILENERGPFIAVSDYMKIVPDQIAKWVPGGLTTLGTDGFGRSDTRQRLRRFFEIDAESTVLATLHALAQRGDLDRAVVGQAIKDLNIDPEKRFPQIAGFLIIYGSEITSAGRRRGFRQCRRHFGQRRRSNAKRPGHHRTGNWQGRRARARVRRRQSDQNHCFRGR